MKIEKIRRENFRLIKKSKLDMQDELNILINKGK